MIVTIFPHQREFSPAESVFFHSAEGRVDTDKFSKNILKNAYFAVGLFE
jgi:hypothetical protein